MLRIVKVKIEVLSQERKWHRLMQGIDVRQWLAAISGMDQQVLFVLDWYMSSQKNTGIEVYETKSG